MQTRLYHVSGWSKLRLLYPGDVFSLRPGPQGAEGPGVYFSEGSFRLTAAEGARGIPSAIVEIVATSTRGWWRTKSSIAKKFHRPITWHTDGKEIYLMVVDRLEEPGMPPLLHCRWDWT